MGWQCHLLSTLPTTHLQKEKKTKLAITTKSKNTIINSVCNSGNYFFIIINSRHSEKLSNTVEFEIL